MAKIGHFRWFDNEIEYLLDIYGTGSYVEFDSAISCNLKQGSHGSEYLDFILTSSLDITLLIENATHAGLITTILNSGENEIYCEFGTLTETIFNGYIVPENIEIENAPYPYELRLSFTDSIGKLKEIQVPQDIYNKKKVDLLLNDILALIDVGDIHDTDYIVMRPGYLPIGTTGNPYSDIIVHLATFTDNYKRTGWDCLNELCRLFHSRFYYSKGLYYFENIDIRLNSTFTQYLGATTTTQNNSVIAIDTDLILRGGKINFLPGINKVFLKYKFDTDKRLSILTPYLWLSPGLLEVGQVAKTDNTGIRFEFEWIFEAESLVDITSVAIITMSFTIKVGSYYYVRTVEEIKDNGTVLYTDEEWTTTAGDFEYVLRKPIIIRPKGGDSQLVELHQLFTINTLPITESGLLSIDQEFVSWYDINANEDYSLSAINIYNYLKVIGDEDSALNEVTYQAINDKNHKQLHFDGILIDLQNSGVTNNLQRFSAWLFEGWKLETGDNLKIQDLFVRSVLNLRESIRKLYYLEVFKHDRMYLEDLIDYDTDCLILQIEHDFMSSMQYITAFQLEKGVLTYTYEEDKKSGLDFAGNSDIISVINSGEDTSTQTEVGSRIIETSEPLSTGAITEVPVIKMYGNYYEGDYFDIVNNLFMRVPPTWGRPPKKDIDLLMLTEDVTEDDIILKCTGALSVDYPAMSEIVFKGRPLQVPIIIDTSGVTTQVSVTNLPDPAKLSLTALRRKVKIKNQGVEMRLVLEADLDHYNDFAIVESGGNLIIKFTTDHQGNFMVLTYEKWEDLL